MPTEVQQKTELQKLIYIHSNVKQQDLHRACIQSALQFVSYTPILTYTHT